MAAHVRIQRVYLFRIFGRLFVERIALTNLGPTALRAPLWLVVSDLLPGVHLVSRRGHTCAGVSAGSPYQAVPVHRLGPDQTCTMYLLFFIPPHRRLFYDATLLEGPAPFQDFAPVLGRRLLAFADE